MINAMDMADIIAGAERKSETLLREIERKFNRPQAEILNGIVYQQAQQGGAQLSEDVKRRMEARYGQG